jgi:hypothetical protein
MGANDLVLSGTTGDLIFAGEQIKVFGGRQLEFGADIGKELNAGKIYYTTENGGMLDIIGGGQNAGSRIVRILDNLRMVGDISLNGHNRLRFHPDLANDPNVGIIRLDDDNAAIVMAGWGSVGNRKLRLRDDAEVSRNLLVGGSITTPRLTVNGRQVDGGNLYNSDGSLTGPRSVNLNGNNLLFRGIGRIGIGTNVTTPRAPLHIENGSYDGYASATNHYIDPTIVGGPNNQNNPYFTAITAPWINGNQAVSIFARGHIITESSISCVTGLVWSDERLKVIKGVSDAQKDLSLLNQIQITDYQMKDTVQFGRTVQKKVIAQQVEKIFPSAVTCSTQFVPDIYQQGTIQENRVTVAGAAHVKKGDLVRILVENDGREEKLELRVSAAGKEGFTVESQEKLSGKVFVYGMERTDVRSVDYDAIAMLNVSATQELAKRQEATTRELAAVRADRDKLAAKVEAQTTRVEAQAREIDALKKQQAAEIAQINAALEVLSKLVEMKVTDKAAKVVSAKAR